MRKDNDGGSGGEKRGVWVDGCFDMFHYGHANALRQARSLGDFLVVGVHSDRDILCHKGPTVMTEAERYAAVRSCRWADRVVEDAPYITSIETMDAYGCAICVHGDDEVQSADGKDVYEAVKAAGRFVEVRRTGGVSTTNLLARMLDGTGRSALLPGLRSSRIAQFAANHRMPSAAEQIVYMSGSFDLAHVGHLSAFRQAKSIGSYLVVGIYGDQAVYEATGEWPVMSLEERVLGVLACSSVDDVVIGAPMCPDDRFLDDRAGRGCIIIATDSDCSRIAAHQTALLQCFPFSCLTKSAIIERINGRRGEYEQRNAKKATSDAPMRARGFV